MILLENEAPRLTIATKVSRKASGSSEPFNISAAFCCKSSVHAPDVDGASAPAVMGIGMAKWLRTRFATWKC